MKKTLLILFYTLLSAQLWAAGNKPLLGTWAYYQKHVDIQTNNPQASQYLALKLTQELGSEIASDMAFGGENQISINNYTGVYKTDNNKLHVYTTDFEGKAYGEGSTYIWQRRGDTLCIQFDIKDQCNEYSSTNKNTRPWTSFGSTKPIVAQKALVEIQYLKLTGNETRDMQRKIYEPNEANSQPYFAQDNKSLKKFIADNWVAPNPETLDNYRDEEVKTDFIVSQNGKIRDIEVGSTNTNIQLAIIQFLQKMPDMIPAQIDGKNVDTRHSLSLNIKGPKNSDYAEVKMVRSAPAPHSSDEDVFTDSDEEAEFEGGYQGLVTYLSNHIEYPDEALNEGTEGRVLLRFVVDKEGRAINPIILQTPSDALAREAVRVMREMPRWTPGRVNGKAVSVYYTLPIDFKLPQ